MTFIKKLLTASALASLLCTFSASAQNNVSEINIDVTVKNDGSAYIVQSWHGTFDSGTENYIPINTADTEISDFRVADEKGEYSYADSWDIDSDFDEKARRCGINETADGIELCFGISEYGEKSYKIEYSVSPFIKSYTDRDGTNFMFINPDMSTFPTAGHIRIAAENGTALNEDNCSVWAFGFDGAVEFQDGIITADTHKNLTGDNSMIIMLSLNKGIVFPSAETGISFESVKNRAFEGSDYDFGGDFEDVGILGTIIGFVILLSVPAFIMIVIILILSRRRAIRKFYGEAEYFRDVPNGGKIDVSHYLAQSFNVSGEESLVIGALMLSMINKGVLEPQTDESVGFFGRTKKSVNLRLIKEPDVPSELNLYRLLSLSAGEDGILQENELENYSYAHPEEINSFIDSVKESGKAEFISRGGFIRGAGNRISDLSDKGKSELSEVMGLKKYLSEFTLISEREVNEVSIWKEYMIYAVLFGIGEKVIKQLEKLYPDKLPEITAYNRNVIIATGYCRSMYSSSQRAIQARRTSGGGGLASLGGGGGFSGGGRGGGSR